MPKLLKVDNFTDRFMGALTALLVMAALLSTSKVKQ